MTSVELRPDLALLTHRTLRTPNGQTCAIGVSKHDRRVVREYL